MRLSALTTKIQRRVGATPDGIYGPQTARAVLAALGEERGPDEAAAFPSQSRVREGRTEFGHPGDNLTTIIPAYDLRLSWDPAVVVSRISINASCADSAGRIFQDTLEHYGIEEIRRLRLDLFGGCYNQRRVRGGTAWSIHAWAAAIDLDPERNALRMDHKEAAFARPEYADFWKIVESHGWTSLGREKDYDWMHFQAPGLD